MSGSSKKRAGLGLAIGAAFAVAACGARPLVGTREDPACRVSSPTQTTVIARFGFVRRDTMRPTVADGFDLDGRVSTESDLMGCRQLDFTSPDGTPGVDNQLALLLPLVDQMTGGALDGAIQSAINNGQLLVTLTVGDLDNRCEDDAVTVRVQRVAGMPFIGADMFIDPGQTFDLQRMEVTSETTGSIHGSVLETVPFTLALPVAVLDARFTLNFYGSRLRAHIDEDGTMEGVIGGGIARDEFSMHVHTFNIPSALMTTIDTSLRLFADLAPASNRQCAQISGAVRFTSRPAFVNP